MDKDSIIHNVQLIKNNTSIKDSSKEEISNLMDFLLDSARTNNDMKYLSYRLNQLKDTDKNLADSFSFNEILNHVLKNQ